jgi:hypothetical protein
MSRAPAATQSLAKVARRAARTAEIAFTTVVAWAFGLVSAGLLLFAASGLYHGDSSVATPLTAAETLMAAPSGVTEASPWALTFAGKQGAMIAIAEGAGVLIALGLSMMFGSNPRRFGCLLLAFWAGLWAVDAALIVGHSWTGSGFSAPMQFIAAAALLMVVFGCMIHRMTLLWQIRVTKA